MLKLLSINAYRGLHDVKFDELSNINIIVGENNSGKTSVLEAINLLMNYEDVNLLLDSPLNRYSRISIDALKSMFDVSKTKPIICIEGNTLKQEEFHCHMTWKESNKIHINENHQITEDYQENEDTEITSSFKLFFDFDSKKNEDVKDSHYIIELLSKDSGYDVMVYTPNENNLVSKIPCHYISMGRHLYLSKLIKNIDWILEENRRNDLLDVLKIFDKKVCNFEILGKDRMVKVFKEGKSKPLSLNDYGNGMYKAFCIAVYILMCRNGILLIDEVETGIHNKAMQDFMPYLLKACEVNKVQLFFSTHSLETIDNILDSNNNKDSNILAYHIKRKLSKTILRKYEGVKLKELRNDFGFDVR